MPDNGRAEFVSEIFEGIKTLVDTRLRRFLERLEIVEKRLPEKGDPGKDGGPGKDAPAVDVTAIVAGVYEQVRAGTPAILELELPARIASAIAALPRPKDGEPGKDATPVDVDGLRKALLADVRAEMAESIAASVGTAVALLPVPKDGEPGRDADAIDYPRIAAWIREEVGERVKLLPLPEKGDKGDPGIGVQGEPGPPGRGDPGRDGRDAHDPELIGRVVEQQLAKHLAASRWEIEQDERDITLKATLGGLVIQEFRLHFDTMLFRSVYRQGDTYQRGDVASWDGSSWHCNKETTEKPGVNGDWTLMTKRGRDGRDAGEERGARAPEPIRMR